MELNETEKLCKAKISSIGQKGSLQNKKDLFLVFNNTTYLRILYEYYIFIISTFLLP